MSEKLFAFASADEPSDVTRIPILRADIVKYKSGLEQRNRVWTYPWFQFDIQRERAFRDGSVNSIGNFWLEHGGNHEVFLWQPAADQSATRKGRSS